MRPKLNLKGKDQIQKDVCPIVHIVSCQCCCHRHFKSNEVIMHQMSRETVFVCKSKYIGAWPSFLLFAGACHEHSIVSPLKKRIQKDFFPIVHIVSRRLLLPPSL